MVNVCPLLLLPPACAKIGPLTCFCCCASRFFFTLTIDAGETLRFVVFVRLKYSTKACGIITNATCECCATTLTHLIGTPSIGSIRPQTVERKGRLQVCSPEIIICQSINNGIHGRIQVQQVMRNVPERRETTLHLCAHRLVVQQHFVSYEYQGGERYAQNDKCHDHNEQHFGHARLIRH